MSTTPLNTDPLDPGHMRPSGAGVTTPIPDPTTLTTAQLIGAVASLRELLSTQIVGQKELFDARLDGMDKAIELLQVISDRGPANMDRRVESLQKLHEKMFEVHLEKIAGINNRFEQLDKRLDKSAADATVALANALQAAKELVGVQNENNAASILKSDTATDKKLEGQGVAINTMREGFNTSLNEVKGRLDRWESAATGRAEQQLTTRDDRKESRDISGVWIAIGGLGLSLIGALGLVIAK